MPDPKKPIDLDDIDFGHTIRGHQKGDRVFDRFVLEKLLGRGGMGVVWLAKDERLGREVALKFAPEAVRFDEVAVDELKEETRKGLNLAHPHIVKIYDFLVDEEHAAISMEFIDGENLGALRTRQPGKIFEPRQIAHWVGQFLEALDYAHRIARVIHRDLKPANLMIDREGNLRVTDFGIARSISDAMNRATMGGNSTGTLAYMSPQQADGKKPHVSDDIYAFGSTIYELLTGKPPFFSGNIAAQLHSDPVVSLTERRAAFGLTNSEPIPVEWEHTILACLEKSPENRPPSAQAIRQRLGLAPTTPSDVPPIPAIAGGAPAGTAAPHTAHPGTHTHVRAGAGLTEVDVPGRQLVAGNIQIGPSVSQLPAVKTQASPARSSAGLWIALAVLVLGLGVFGTGAWWVWNHTSYFKPAKQPDVVAHPPPPVVPPVKPDPGPGINAPVVPPPPVVSSTTTIQGMINQAKPGAEVIVPEGIYEEQLRFKEGITLRAAQPGKVTVQTDGKVGSALLVEGCKTGSISGFVFQHTGTEVAEKESWPVVLLKSSSIALEGCTVQSGVADGLHITGAGKAQVTRCIVQNNTKNGVVFDSGSTAILSATECRKNGESGAEARHTGTSPVLQGCLLADNGLAGFIAKDGASASILEKTASKNNGDAGFAAAGAGVQLTVVDAISENNLVGIAIQNQAKGSIRDSTIRLSKQAGIQIGMAAEGTEVLNNTVEQSKIEGMLVGGASGVSMSIIGNKLKGNGGSGIGVFGAGFKAKVEQNECFTNGEYGIVFTEGAGGSVRDNTSKNNNLGSIGNFGAAPDLVIEGNLIDAK